MVVDQIRGRVGLRLRIATLAALAVGGALALSAVFLVDLLRSRLDDAATTAAQLRSTDVAALASAGTLPTSLALPGEESAFVQVIDADGIVVAATENIDGEPMLVNRRPVGERPLIFTSEMRTFHEHDRMQIVALNATTPTGHVTVFAGESLERADETVADITRAVAGAVPLLALIVGSVTWWAVGRTLRPVRAITRTMGEITATDLHRRVPEPKSRDEIGQLAHTVNDTLSRLDQSVDRQRRFVADASHELRGPLAALRADLEISVTHPGATSWVAVARDTLSDVERLQQLTDDLLLLARLDAKQSGEMQLANLSSIVSEELDQVRRRDLVLTATGLDSPVTLTGSRDQLRRMTRNLIHNAENHAVSHLDVSLRRNETTVTLQIGDDGAGIPLADRDRVFERFVRLDQARTRDSGGTGLGLAIAQEIVASHHGVIRIDETESGGALFVLELPINQLPAQRPM